MRFKNWKQATPGVLMAACAALSFAANAANDPLVAQGKYLSDAGGCAECHTAPQGRPFAGGLMMDTPFGPISTPNITPDKGTGIGEMSDEQFYRVMHEGLGRHGEYLYPVMPFPWYTKVSHDDVLAIKAYLFSLAPVHQPRPASHLKFPFNIRTSLAAWRLAFFSPASFKPDLQQSAQINRGNYLVNGLGHCGECHNSQRLAGASQFQGALQGGVIDNWYAPNITSDVKDGIGGWSDAQIIHFLKSGERPGRGIVVGPMAQTVHSLQKLSDDDLGAMAAYLKSTAPVANGKDARTSISTGEALDVQAAGAYLDHCASCHGLDGKGLAGVVPPLAGNGSVQAQGPQNIIQVILGGLPANKGYAPMLAVGAGMGDADVAVVTNYVRQKWGNHAPASASATMVADLRATIDTPMTAGRVQGCPASAPPSLSKALGDGRSGTGGRIAGQLAATTDANMTQQVALIVKGVKTAAPAAGNADVVNGLTGAYCRVVRQDAKLDWNQRALQLGHFSELVYMQLHEATSLH